MIRFDRWEWERMLFRDGRLSAADRHVALTLAHHFSPKTGDGAFPSIRTLAAECARKAQTVIASTRTLEALGYLEVTRDPRHSVDRDVNRYAAKMPAGTTQMSSTSQARQALGAHAKLSAGTTSRNVASYPEDASRGAVKLAEGAHELPRSSPSADAAHRGASAALDDCLGNCESQHPLHVLEQRNGYCPECDPPNPQPELAALIDHARRASLSAVTSHADAPEPVSP
jgi:hypothetical protein